MSGNLLVVFGGPSAEHDISIISARTILANLPDGWTPVLVGLNGYGDWFHIPTESLAELETIRELRDGFPRGHLKRENTSVVLESEGESIPIDVAIPVLHGPFGEDGTIQGLFEMLNLPYVGSRVLASAVGMDKITMKKLLQYHGIRTPNFLAIDRWTPVQSFDAVSQHLGTPFFVKPSNMGSSIGVHRVESEKEYQEAINDAQKYDSRMILEEAIYGRELETAVLDDGKNLRVSCVGEIITDYDVYSYEAKYVDPNGAIVQVPANLPATTSEQIRSLAKKVFEILDCRHLARIDFFLADTGLIYVNEPNTFPGCTPISLFPMAWAAEKLSMKDVLERLINDIKN